MLTYACALQLNSCHLPMKMPLQICNCSVIQHAKLVHLVKPVVFLYQAYQARAHKQRPSLLTANNRFAPDYENWKLKTAHNRDMGHDLLPQQVRTYTNNIHDLQAPSNPTGPSCPYELARGAVCHT